VRKSAVPDLLALDTSTEFCSAAVLRGGQVFARSMHAGQTHSQLILPMIGTLLDEAGLRLADCAALAFGAGPGSFTGLRIACSVAQGLAWGAGLQVLPVGTLAALAEACRDSVDLAPGARVLAALDARMAEVYWGVWEWDGAEWVEHRAPALARPADLAVLLEDDAPAWGCGNAFDVYADALRGRVGTVAAPRLPDARHIAQLGVRALVRGGGQPAQRAAPLYVRNQVALTTEERARAATQKRALGAMAAVATTGAV